MHTTRNRQARPAHKAGKPPAAAPPPKTQSFMLQTPPQHFPADLIVPPHRGAVITAAPWPQPPAAPMHTAAVQGRKAARKAARRAAARERSQAIAVVPQPVQIAMEPAPIVVEPEQVAPLPAARALVPRQQGFFDVVAFMLRDSGRRLSRWSSARRRADELKQKLARAEARMRAMEAQMAALQALQQHVRQS